MGRYFNPANETAAVKAGGRRLRIASHAALVEQLKPGESLGIFLDRFIFTQIADVTDPREFQEFWRQAEDGDVLLLGFFAMPSEGFK